MKSGVELREIIQINYGKSLKSTLRSTVGQIPVYGANGIVGYHDKALTLNSTIVIGRKGSAGEITFAPQGGWPIDTTFYIEIKDHNAVDLRYLFYALQQVGLTDKTITTSIPGINRDEIYRTKIHLPLIEEQQRIAAVLDKVDDLRAKRQRAIVLLDDLLQSMFIDMFGDPVSNNKGWKFTPAGEVFEIKLGKMRSEKNYTGKHLHPYLRNANVQWGKIDLSDVKYLDFSPSEMDRYRLEPGDILVCEGGEVGRTAIFSGEIADCGYQNALHRLRPLRPIINAQYFVQYMKLAAHYGLINRLTSQVTIAHFTAEKFRTFPVMLPPIEMQNKYQDFVNALSKLKARMDNAELSIEKAINSFQQTSFD